MIRKRSSRTGSSNLLRRDEEKELVQLSAEGDHGARDALIIAFIPLIQSTVYRSRGPYEEYDDLFDEAVIGLIDAIRLVDPDRTTRFSSFAKHHLRGTCGSYLYGMRSIVRLPGNAAWRRAYHNFDRAMARKGFHGEWPLPSWQIAILADDLGVATQDIVDLDAVLHAPPANPALLDENAEDLNPLIEHGDMHDELAEREQTERRREMLAEAISQLPEQSREILEARRLSDPPIILDKLAERYGLSAQRIRQIEVRAFDRTQKAVMMMLTAFDQEEMMERYASVSR